MDTRFFKIVRYTKTSGKPAAREYGDNAHDLKASGKRAFNWNADITSVTVTDTTTGEILYRDTRRGGKVVEGRHIYIPSVK